VYTESVYRHPLRQAEVKFAVIQSQPEPTRQTYQKRQQEDKNVPPGR
jgi:hypothetical protein